MSKGALPSYEMGTVNIATSRAECLGRAKVPVGGDAFPLLPQQGLRHRQLAVGPRPSRQPFLPTTSDASCLRQTACAANGLLWFEPEAVYPRPETVHAGFPFLLVYLPCAFLLLLLREVTHLRCLAALDLNPRRCARLSELITLIDVLGRWYLCRRLIFGTVYHNCWPCVYSKVWKDPFASRNRIC